MSTILVTGASGLLGGGLIKALAKDHTVLAMSRSKVDLDGVKSIQGDFASESDLAQLDNHKIDVTVHLAAVTGGCSEKDGMLVNVEGTRVLTQYMASRGCKKMVFASSIATVGIQNVDMIPEQLPILETHGCQDRDGYGLSKYMMEILLAYLSRQHADMDLLAIRLSSCTESKRVPEALHERKAWFLGAATHMVLEDGLNLFKLAAEAEYKPGLRILNGVPSELWCRFFTSEQIKHWWGNRVDTAWYEKPENRYASIFDSSRIKSELGFEATGTLAILAASRGKVEE